MKTRLSIFLISFLWIISGCVPSLNPLYTEEDLVYNNELIGTWIEIKSKETWTFSQKSKKEYWLNHSENNDAALFEAHLVKLGDFLFIDLYPSELKSSNYLYQTHLYPVHTFSKIRISKNQIVIKILNPIWLEESVENKRINIDYVRSDETILLTAKTTELQNFVLKYALIENAFPDSLILIKK